jgi:hypothetical protein
MVGGGNRINDSRERKSNNEWKKKSIKKTHGGLGYSCQQAERGQKRVSMRLVEERQKTAAA